MTSGASSGPAECPPEERKERSAFLGNCGPDGSLAWQVTAACSWFSFFAWLPVVCSPVLYAGYLDQFPSVPRRSASWPFTVMMAVINLGGVFYAIGAEWLSEQRLTLLAAVLCSGSLIVVSFANNVLLLVIFLGIAYGLGVASTSIIPTVLVIQHFTRYRATALGIVSGSIDISGMSTPSLTQLLIDIYGFSGCILILGALSFNLFIACFFLKRAPWVKKDERNNKCDSIRRTHNLNADSPISYRDLRLKELANESSTGDLHKGNAMTSDLQQGSRGDVRIENSKAAHKCSNDDEIRCWVQDDDGKLTETSRPSNVGNAENATANSSSETTIIPTSGAEFRDAWQSSITTEGEGTMQKNILPSLSLQMESRLASSKDVWNYSHLMNFLERLRSASSAYLWAVCITKGASNLCSYTFSLILVDYAHDAGVRAYRAATLPAIFSVGCLCGTLLTGPAVDRTWISKHSALTFSFVVQGVALVTVSWWDAYPLLGTGSFFVGFGRGIRCFLFPVLISDRCALRDLPVAFSIMNAVCSVALFLRTPVLGLLRDRSGSYATLLLTLATINVVQLALWLCHIALMER